MLHIGINNSSIGASLPGGDFCVPHPTRLRSLRVGQDQGQRPRGRTRWPPAVRRHRGRPGLRLPHGQRLARQLHRLGSGTVRTVSVLDLKGNGHGRPTRIRNHISRQTSCAPPFLRTPTCRHSNLGPRPLAALNEGCLRRCLRRREAAKKPNSRSRGLHCVLIRSTSLVATE